MTADSVVYSLNTCTEQDSTRSYLPHILLSVLHKKLKQAQKHFRERFIELTETMSAGSGQCNMTSSVIDNINRAERMDELLYVSLGAISSTVLNLTIINCHTHSVHISDVHSKSLTIINVIQKLLYRIEYEHGVCRPRFSLPHPSLLTEGNMLAFTCKNLSMAESLYRAISTRLLEIWIAELESLGVVRKVG